MTAPIAGRHTSGAASGSERKTLPRVLLLTDRSQLPLGRSLLATVEAAVSAGVDHVVLRELDLPEAQRSGLADEFIGVGVTVIAAHRPVPGCVAVHLPAAADSSRYVAESSLPRRSSNGGVATRPHTVMNRHPVEPFGRSCHSAAEVRAAAAEGASYATLGPFAPTESKPGYGPPLEPNEYADLPIPTFALGGITAGNAADVRTTGAYGVAVMGAVMRAADPAATARALLEEVT